MKSYYHMYLIVTSLYFLYSYIIYLQIFNQFIKNLLRCDIIIIHSDCEELNSNTVTVYIL
ncbi:hypothetical protein BDBG_18047, partial [Blastomyces gilchristii SLH14081]